MEMNYEKWHDGIGYDLGALAEATPKERAAIEGLLVARRPRDWRDVEALAALDTPRARKELVAALGDANAEVRLAVTRHAPHLVPDADKRAGVLGLIA